MAIGWRDLFLQANWRAGDFAKAAGAWEPAGGRGEGGLASYTNSLQIAGVFTACFYKKSKVPQLKYGGAGAWQWVGRSAGK